MYHQNIILFIQKILNFTIFKEVLLIKNYISTSFQNFILKWYISKLNNIEQNGIKNNLSLQT